MGQVYDKPRDRSRPTRRRRSLRYQIMDVVDQIRWIPGFGYERELDWLRTMADWMISQEALLGPGAADLGVRGVRRVRRHRRPRRAGAARGRGLGGVRGPHAAPAVRGRGQGRVLSRAARRRRASRDVGNPWLDAGIVPFSTLHYRTDPDYWREWFPADFITESFPGQFRNWFYSLLAMSTVLRREPPFKTILGYATLFGEDGRAMHKSWGNAIEFNEAAERMGVDVMRWMFAKQARGQHPVRLRTADEARRELLVLWNVYRVLRQVRPARRLGARAGIDEDSRAGSRPVLDRWILSRTAGSAAETVGARWPTTTLGRPRCASARYIDDLSTWYLRRSRRRMSRNGDRSRSRRGVRHAARGARQRWPDRWRPSCRSWPRSCTRA